MHRAALSLARTAVFPFVFFAGFAGFLLVAAVVCFAIWAPIWAVSEPILLTVSGWLAEALGGSDMAVRTAPAIVVLAIIFGIGLRSGSRYD